MMWRRKSVGESSLLAAVVLATTAGLAGGEDVNIDTVAVVSSFASKWDLRGSADGGCGVGGCDPRLTVDGHDNTLSESRWSCQPSIESENADCSLYFTFDHEVTMSYLMLYFHESDDDTKAAISYSVNTCAYGSVSTCTYRWALAGSFETVPGTALGDGERANLLNPTGKAMQFVFTLTDDQWISINEVEVFVDVSSSDSYELVDPTERAIFEAGDITTVTSSATKWDLDGSDNGGCGVGGCEPELTRDGDDNTVGDSRWSCETALPGESESCELYYVLEDSYTASYLMMYFHEIDDATATAISFTVYSCSYSSTSTCTYRWDVMITNETKPGTELGVGQRVNLPRPTTGALKITFDLAATQVIGVNEVDIFVTLYGEDIPVNIAAVTTPAPQAVGTSTTPAPVEDVSNVLVTPAPSDTVADRTPSPIADPVSTPSPAAVVAVNTPAPIAVDTPSPTAIIADSPAPMADLATTPPPTTIAADDTDAPVSAMPLIDTPPPVVDTPSPTKGTPAPTQGRFGKLGTAPPVEEPSAPSSAAVADEVGVGSGAFGLRASIGVTRVIIAVVSASVSLAFFW